MLVITGTQRSGTSLIARALIESGYDLGSNWFDKKVQGGYEHEMVCMFYRQYLGDPDFPFRDMNLPTYQDCTIPFQRLDFEVIKFSYLLMNPAFVSIWHKFRPEGDTFLVMDRPKKQVLKSKARHWNQFDKDSYLLQQSARTLKDSFHRSLTLLRSLGYPAYLISFPACITAGGLDEINKGLNYLDPNVQIQLEVWERVLDETKIHFGMR